MHQPQADLQERRRQLPFTWHWHAHDPDVPDATWRRLFSLASERDMLRHLDWCERKYGVGHYAERRDLLESTLAFLTREERVDLPTVVDVLAKAKTAKDTAMLVGTGIDDTREFTVERERIRRNTTSWLRRLSSFQHERTAPPSRPHPLAPAVQDALTYLKQSPLFMAPVKTPTCRARRGHQPEPWIAEAKRGLSKAKVPKALHTDLLIAVGLLPFELSKRTS